MALAVGVLDQEHLARANNALLAVACRDLHGAVEIDDVLPTWCGMPRIVVGARRLAEDDAGRRERRRGLAAGTLVLPFDLDVAEMRLALGVDVEVMDAHENSSHLVICLAELRTKPCSRNPSRPPFSTWMA